SCQKKKDKSNEWFDAECEELIRKKKEARLKWMRTKLECNTVNYTESRKLTTKILRRKKTEWIENFLENLENENKNHSKLYQYIKKQNRRKTFNNIENSEWIAHFIKPSTEERNAEMCERRDNKNIDNNSETALTKVEYEEIIGNLKNKRTSGPDSITNEMIKYGGKKIVEQHI
ncbi:hypothetical protein HHI36_002660, partial [Cryptolaemus montrouzieri]